MEIDPARYVWEQVRDELRRRIADGTYPVRLPGEIDLARDLGVARGSVRRAIAALADDGDVRVLPGKGVYVVRPGDGAE